MREREREREREMRDIARVLINNRNIDFIMYLVHLG